MTASQTKTEKAGTRQESAPEARLDDPRMARCDYHLCDAHMDPSRLTHHPDCPGSAPNGWRARVPEFLLPEYERVQTGRVEDTPEYRELAMGYAKRANDDVVRAS